ncbi:MAG: hypothetical protein QOD60_109 [Solirubrobacterales bacterium]|nr:hypothetical protein [Solirubrobacterales bacterium]
MNQQTSAPAEPWRELPAEVADVIEPELPAVTADIFEAIAKEVPEYQRPLEGAFGKGLRVGVTEALRQFVALIRDPDSGRGQGRAVYVGLGRGELRQGRSLDSLLSAYRIGARVAWRRLGDAGLKAGLEPEVLNRLAEAIFAYIDGLSVESIEGYAEASRAIEGERERLRTRLLALLAQRPAAPEEDIKAASRAAGWRLPNVAAMIACAPEDLGRLVPGLPAGSLASTLGDLGCAVVPDPEGPGHSRELKRAARRLTVAVGPSVPTAELGRSWAAAAKLAEAIAGGEVEGAGVVRADDHLMAIALNDSGELLAAIAGRRLEPFAGLTPRARKRMTETLLAYLRLQGAVPAIAEELHVHPQTVRYRLARLRELLGDQLDDADARFELEAVLRAGVRDASG